VKAENNFKEYLAKRDEFYKVVNKEEYLKGEWTAAKASKLTKVMFGFYANDGEKFEFTQQDFAKLIEQNKPKSTTDVNIVADINRLYAAVLEEKTLKFKEDRLPKTNMEYKLLYQEYRDGILLFNLTDQKVWSKAIADSAGLANYFAENQKNYMWNKRAEATIYKCLNEEIALKVEKIISKKTKKPLSNDEILKLINTDSQLSLNIEEGKFEKGENSSVDATEWMKGKRNKVKTANGVDIVVITNVLEAEPKKLNEVKGLVTSDYQNYLEKQWVDELKSKYKVEVNNEVLKMVK
ncbi:MAG TPA: hypothetical protein PK649_12470, partial [Vicingus sp.]|nr:hypothetical protein [Vicingus sp.]